MFLYQDNLNFIIIKVKIKNYIFSTDKRAMLKPFARAKNEKRS